MLCSYCQSAMLDFPSLLGIPNTRYLGNPPFFFAERQLIVARLLNPAYDRPMGDDFQAAMEKLGEARRLEREAKLTLFYQLARELNIPVSEVAAAATPDQQPKSPEPPEQPREPRFSFDGTFGGLIDAYRSHDDSSYHKLKHTVRLNYDGSLNRLKRDIGTDRIIDWNPKRIQTLYDENWAAGDKIAMGHTMIGRLRLLTGFGSVTLNDDACTRLSAILANMRFPNSRGRSDILTVDQARAIRATAHNQFNWSSIALAQAFLITLPMLRVVDIIGEWVPISEPGMSDIRKENEKWVRGLRWSDIDDNMVLRRVLTSGRKNQQKEVEFNLKKRGGIIEEINRVPPEKRVGPMIICEFSNLPWTTNEFRRKWRMVANKAGVPKSVQFSDSARSEEESELGADTAL